MSSKRKTIRKLTKKHRMAARALSEEQQVSEQTLLEQLISGDKEHSIAFLANIAYLPANAASQLLPQLIKVLYSDNQAWIHSCLFAITNLCEFSSKVVAAAFELGLGQALMQVKQPNKELFHPILVLMTAVCEDIPEKYRFMLQFLEKSITPEQVCSPDCQLIMLYFTRRQTSTLTPPITNKIYAIYEASSDLKMRALALSVLLANNASMEQVFLENIEEYINGLNLLNQFRYNIDRPEKETDALQEVEEAPCEEEKPYDAANYQRFIDAIEAVEIMMETILTAFENDWAEQSVEGDKMEGDKMEEEEEVQCQQSQLKTTLIAYFTNHPEGLLRNSSLPFIEGQTLAELSLRVMGYLPLPTKESKWKLSQHVISAMGVWISLHPERPVLLNNLEVGLQILVKCQYCSTDRTFLLELGEKVLRIDEDDKDCWILLLQLYSFNFNPERQKVTKEDNFKVGVILKRVISSMPPLNTLDECKGQAIDTLFDVFCNQDYDDVFSHLGFFELLKTVRQNNASKTKFIRDILADIERFRTYKEQQIKIKG